MNRDDAQLGKYEGSAISTDADMFVTGHTFDIYERGVDHAQSCPCVNYQLPA